MLEYHDGGWWVVMWVSMAIFWGLLIIGAVTIASWFGGGGRTREDSADDILGRRLATGEIDPERYRALSDELHAASRGVPRTVPH